MNTFISGFHYDAHPMAMMAGVVGSLAAFYHDKMDMDDPEHRMLAAKRMIAKALPEFSGGRFSFEAEPVLIGPGLRIREIEITTCREIFRIGEGIVDLVRQCARQLLPGW